MQFKDVIGQEEIKKHLINTVNSNRLSHALLFLGPQGCGKLPMALALAQYINCTNKSDIDSCGGCPACKKSSKHIYPDTHFVFPVVKSNSSNSPVSDTYIKEWRSYLTRSPYFSINQWFKQINSDKGQGMIYTNESTEIVRKLNLKSFEGEYKVMIIWHPELMHVVASNKLLKMIEEPPSKTIFILITESTEGILDTILSRTQQLKFPVLSENDIRNGLIKSELVDEKAAELASQLAGGDYINAVNIARESEEYQAFFEQFVALMRLAYGRKLIELYEWIDSIIDMPKISQKNFLMYALRMIRENYIMNLKQPSLVYLTPDEENFSSRFSPFINDNNAIAIAEEISLAHSHLEQNGNARIIFTDFALKLIILLKE